MKDKMIVKKIWSACALAIVLFLAAALIAPSFEIQAAGTVKSISVTNLPAKQLTLKKGASKTLKVSVAVTGKASKAVTYTSSNKKVATVNSKGKVTAKKKGTAKITITSKANKKKKVTITVTVGTPVTKVKLNKTSASIDVKKKVTLKATLSKKPSNKGVVWKSSNTKVATVNSKGVVTGKKAGKAKITATAKDGSGKKATCTVTVKDPLKISSVTVLNSSVIKVTLNRAKALELKDFTVKTKEYDFGKYNHTCELDSISTDDQISYQLVLNDYIEKNRLVQISVTGLSAVEARYSKTYNYNNDMIYTATQGKSVNEDLYFDGDGYSTCTVKGLPNGIKYTSQGKYIEFSGTPSKAGVFTSQVVASDEVGNVYTYNISWIVGSGNQLAAAVNPYYGVISPQGSKYISATIRVMGGSGDYTYKISGKNYGLSVEDEDEDYGGEYYGYGYISGELTAAGSYTVAVTITDANNPSLTTTANLKVDLKAGKLVTGTVKDLNNNAVSYAEVTFTNEDESSQYFTYAETDTDEKGNYSICVEDGSYTIETYYRNITKYIFNKKITGNQTINLSLPGYPVNISSDNSEVSSFGTWYDQNGKSYGSGSRLFLKAGKYNLTCSGAKGFDKYTAVLNITVPVSNNSAKAKVTVEKDGLITGEIKTEQSVNVTLASDYLYYKFVPEETKTYYFYSISDIDTYGELLDSDGEQLTDDDDGGSGNNFMISYECQKGEAYYIGVRPYSSGDRGNDIQLNVSDTNPLDD